MRGRRGVTRVRRRRLIGAVAALAVGAGGGCLANPPGATGPRSPPTGAPADETWGPVENPLVVASFASDPTAAGDLRVAIEIGNRSGGARTGTVTGVVVIDGRHYQREARARVEGNGRSTVTLTYPVSYEAFERDGRFVPSVSTG